MYCEAQLKYIASDSLITASKNRGVNLHKDWLDKGTFQLEAWTVLGQQLNVIC